MFRLVASFKKFLRREERGNPTLEFALIAPMFLILLFGIIESGIMLFNAVILEGAAQEAARQVRTGVVQNSGSPEATFKNLLCDNLFGLMSCDGVTYLVETFPTFTASAMTDMFDADGNTIPRSYADTEPGDVVIVRVARVWTFLTPIIGYAYGTDTMKMITTVVFRNEPFDPPGS